MIEKKYLPADLQRDYDTTWGHQTDYSAAAKPKAKAKR